jgi:hypothetical protein
MVVDVAVSAGDVVGRMATTVDVVVDKVVTMVTVRAMVGLQAAPISGGGMVVVVAVVAAETAWCCWSRALAWVFLIFCKMFDVSDDDDFFNIPKNVCCALVLAHDKGFVVVRPDKWRMTKVYLLCKILPSGLCCAPCGKCTTKSLSCVFPALSCVSTARQTCILR